MAKDPAVLFYTSDFLTGTMTMTNEQVGMYIRLLCLQHQKKFLQEKDMLNICKTYDDDVYSKFCKCELGYYNERMKDEFEKRAKYSESRSKNRIGKTKKTYDNHMEDENENVNVNKKEKESDEMSIYFNEIWELYNKKVNKQSSYNAFKKIKKSEYEIIKSHIQKFVKQQENKQFQPHLSTYLNGKRWEDEIAKESKNGFKLKNIATLDEN
jgi:hypothetical protein